MENVADHPLRRSSDRPPPLWWRWRFWTRDTWAAIIMFALLGVIVLGELSDFYNDREQTKRDTHQECLLGNLADTNVESIRRLRAQAPVLEAARKLIGAQSDAEKLAAVNELRAVGVPRFDASSLAKPRDCDRIVPLP